MINNFFTFFYFLTYYFINIVEIVLLFGDVGAGVVGEIAGVTDVNAENKHIHVVREEL